VLNSNTQFSSDDEGAASSGSTTQGSQSSAQNDGVLGTSITSGTQNSSQTTGSQLVLTSDTLSSTFVTSVDTGPVNDPSDDE